jgi:hypothetical protein
VVLHVVAQQFAKLQISIQNRTYLQKKKKIQSLAVLLQTDFIALKDLKIKVKM